MTHRDLTIAEVLEDPLIRQVMRADRISVAGMANLLQDAALRQQRAEAVGRDAGHDPSVGLKPMARARLRPGTQADLR